MLIAPLLLAQVSQSAVTVLSVLSDTCALDMHIFWLLFRGEEALHSHYSVLVENPSCQFVEGKSTAPRKLSLMLTHQPCTIFCNIWR